jgi:lysophospholipase L1-like esterase
VNAPLCDAGVNAPLCDAGVIDGGSINAPWDWVGVVGTGQSLSVGTPPTTSTKQPYHNMKVQLGGVTIPPWDSTNTAYKMAPLTEPIRGLSSNFPSPYPGNIYGETPHSAMANQITFLAQTSLCGDYQTVHSVVGESGQGIVALRKQVEADGGPGPTDGGTGRAYAATLFEAQVITRLAQAAGKTYGIGVVVMTHGETDSGSSTYKDDLIQLMTDYNADLKAITGQTQNIPMYLSQQHAYPNGGPGQRPLANQIQWQLGVDHKGDFVCTGPKYQYPGSTKGDGVHLSAVGYQLLGEKVAEVYFHRAVLGEDWQPLQPETVDPPSGRVVTVHFHVPVPPLNWDDALDDPAIPEWVNGKGFELRTTGGANIGIESVAISGDAVQITASSDLPAGLVVGYALTSQGVQMTKASNAVRWGKLRDSDCFVGQTSKLNNPNYSVSFELPVP